MGRISHFQQLEAWQEAHKLVLLTYQVTKGFPGDERFGLVSQMGRAPVSIPANIAEGFKRRRFSTRSAPTISQRVRWRSSSTSSFFRRPWSTSRRRMILWASRKPSAGFCMALSPAPTAVRGVGGRRVHPLLPTPFCPRTSETRRRQGGHAQWKEAEAAGR